MKSNQTPVNSSLFSIEGKPSLRTAMPMSLQPSFSNDSW